MSKKTLIIGGAVGVAIAAIGIYVSHKDAKKKEYSFDKPLEKFTEEEQTEIISLIKASEAACKAASSFGVDLDNLTIDDCIVNSREKYICQLDNIIIVYKEANESYSIEVYSDPLYDLAFQHEISN